MKLVFKARELPIGHISTSKTGQKVKKVGPGKWVPVGTTSKEKDGPKKQKTGKSISGLIFKDGFYFDGKVKISNDYEKAKKYIEKKQSKGNGGSKSSIKVGDKIRVKGHAKSNGKVTEHKARGMIAKVKEIGDKFVKIVDETGKVFQVNKMALEFAKSGEVFINDYDLFKSKLLFKIDKAMDIFNSIDYHKKLEFKGLQSFMVKSNDQLKEGIKEEKEHKDLVKKIRSQLKKYGTIKLTDNEIYEIIAKAHLKKNKNYYKLLEKHIETKDVKKSQTLMFNLIKSDSKLDKIKKLLIKILNKNLEKSSSLNLAFFDLIKGRGYPIGTKREWKGKKFIKIGPNKWRRFYEGESRGQKQSIRYITKQIEKAKTIEDLAKIVFENRKRFTNPDGTKHKIVNQLLELAKGKKPEPKKTDKQGRGKDKQKRKEKEITSQNIIKKSEEKPTKSEKESDGKVSLDVDFAKYSITVKGIIKDLGVGKFDSKTFKFVFPESKINEVYSMLAENIEQKRKQKEATDGISPETLAMEEEEKKFLKLKYAKQPGEKVKVGTKEGEVVSTSIDEDLKVKHDIEVKEEITEDVSEEKVKKQPEKDDKKITSTIQETSPHTRQNTENNINGQDNEKDSPEIQIKSNPEIEKMIYDDSYNFPGDSEIHKVKNYTDIREVDIQLIKQKDILKKPKPSYVLPIEDYLKYNKFDPIFVKTGEDKYLIEDKGERNLKGYQTFKPENAKFFVANSSVLMATRDYYIKKSKAEFAVKVDKETEDQMKIFEGVYSKSDKDFEEDIRKRLTDMKYISSEGVELRVKAQLATKKEFETDRKKFEKVVKKQVTKKLKYAKVKIQQLNKVFYSQSNLFKRANPFFEGSVVSEIVRQKRELNQKLEDMEVQQEFDESTFSKGRETSYGDSGTKDTLLKSYGVKVKRQNGDEIDPKETKQIQEALDSMYEAFGKKDEMSEEWGLKISHSGSKMMHAMKAVGVFFPHYRAIGISYGQGMTQAGFTMSHEFGHFMDYYLARNSKENEGYHFASDNLSSLTGQIAKKFRQGMTKPQSSKYYNRTCECFARAMEQYYGNKLGFPIENTSGTYNDNKKFREEISPLIDSFFEDNKDILKSMIYGDMYNQNIKSKTKKLVFFK